MDLRRFKELPVLGILRGIEADLIEPLVEAVVSSGLRTIEITMNTPLAPDLIRRMERAARGRLVVGAGTVLTLDEMRAALDAGATFIVLPVLVREIVEACAKVGIPVFPGALTPQEIFDAWRAGAAMIKVFPVGLFGPEYLKEIHGPFQEIELLACGGVTARNVSAFFACGASAVAFGGSLFRKEWLDARDFARIEAGIRELLAALPENHRRL